jgi:glutamate/tyrosine decarboxylase-like PLP-dependent enzyme
MHSKLPPTAFIHPLGLNEKAIEDLAQAVLDLIVTYSSQATVFSPLPSLHQGLEFATIPDSGIPETVLLEKLKTIVTASMNAAHPGYMGHMDSIPTTFSVLGDLVVAALNNNLLSVEMSPVFSRLEPLLLQEIAQGFGLGKGAGGLLVSGGSLANLQALTVARNHRFPALAKGIWGLAKQPVIFASEVAHTSLQKAAMLLGLGTSAVIPVATNANSQMDLEDLQAKIQESQTHDQIPFALVATAGTTVTGNLDPLVEMGTIAQAHNLWFHIDAAYGGALIFSDRHRDRLRGIEQANSVTFNPQKWLYVTKTCAMVLFRHFDALKTTFRVAAPYMGNDEDWLNLGEVSVQGTRHADILKLWLSLQHLGKQGYAEIINHGYQLTEQLVQGIQNRPFLKLASQPEMNIVCFRGEPAEVNPQHWDQWNADLQQFLLEKAQIFVSLPHYRGAKWLKVVLLNPYIDPDLIDRLLGAIDAFRCV